MGRYYCSTHEREYNHNCPGCQADEAADDRQRIIDSLSELTESRTEEVEEIKQQIEEATYKRANPGDYKCPECLFVTLNRHATRCPMCHAYIPGSYWTEIYERERIAAERESLRKKEEAEKRAIKEKAQAEERIRCEKALAQKNAAMAMFTALVLLVGGLLFALVMFAYLIAHLIENAITVLPSLVEKAIKLMLNDLFITLCVVVIFILFGRLVYLIFKK